MQKICLQKKLRRSLFFNEIAFFPTLKNVFIRQQNSLNLIQNKFQIFKIIKKAIERFFFITARINFKYAITVSFLAKISFLIITNVFVLFEQQKKIFFLIKYSPLKKKISFYQNSRMQVEKKKYFPQKAAFAKFISLFEIFVKKKYFAHSDRDLKILTVNNYKICYM